VTGEDYEVTSEVLHALDGLEGHPVFRLQGTWNGVQGDVKDRQQDDQSDSSSLSRFVPPVSKPPLPF